MKLLTLAALCFASLTVFSQHRQLPEIPQKLLNVLDLGADNSGKLPATTAIQNALDQVGKAGGGKVIIPKGTFLCGPLKISSHTELFLNAGSRLQLITDIEHFPADSKHYLNFIDASQVTDIKISGQGVIDGQGRQWWDQYDRKALTLRRPQLLYMDRPERVEISGVTFLNPPNTHISISNGTDVFIHHISIEAPEKSHNTDGINISARFCSIENCNISTGDDNIALNFSRTREAEVAACERIMIRNCTFGRGHGLSIGSYTAGNLKGLTVKDCSFDGTTSALRIKSARGRGGRVENVLYENITIKNSPSPIFISAYYPKEPIQPESDTTRSLTAQTPHYLNIQFKNINVTGAQYALRMWGLPEQPLEDIRFENVKISSRKGAVLNNVRKVIFTKTLINVSEGDKITSYKADINGL